MTSRGGGSGLTLILLSTAVSGLVGYGIQVAVPAFVSPADYVIFSVAWSTIFLIGTALSGVQQEVSRAVHPGGVPRSSSPLWPYSLIVLASVLATTGVAAIIGSTVLFGDVALEAGIAIIIGAVGYLLVVLLSGVVYGLRRWKLAALITIIDAIVRGAAVIAALVLGADVGTLILLVVAPFFVTFAIVWIIATLSGRESFTVDTTTSQLLRNTVKTVGAAVAMGLMITGLPLLLRASTHDGGVAALAATIFAITLTRAPIVIPVIALQSYIISRVRGADGARYSVRLRHLALITLVIVVVGAVAWFAGPAVVSAISGGRLLIEPFLMAVVAISAVLVAAMAGLGAVLVAASRHDWYLGGWIVAAALTVVFLFSPFEFALRLEVALMIAPAAGLIVHAVGLHRMSIRVGTTARAPKLIEAGADDD